MCFEKKCEFCGKTFRTKRYTARFCCSECSLKFRRKEAENRLLRSVKALHPDEDVFLKDGLVYYRRKCQACGKEFETVHFDDLFCSDSCRTAPAELESHVKRFQQNDADLSGQELHNAVKTCVNCGKRFISTRPNARYCCTECYLDFRKKESLQKHLETAVRQNPELNPFLKDGLVHYRKKCEYCGKDYVSIRKNGRFCCEDCQERYRIRQRSETRERERLRKEVLDPTPLQMKGVPFRIRKKCECCGVEFIAQKASTRFCSSSCAELYRQGRSGGEQENTLSDVQVETRYPQIKDYMRIEEAARYMSVSRSTMYRLISKGLIPYSHINHTSIVTRENLVSFIRESERTGIAPRPVTEVPVHVANPYFGSTRSQDYISISEAAEVYGIELGTMRNYLHKGPLKSIRVGRVKFFLKEDVDRFIKERQKAKHKEIKDWYTVEQIMSTFGMTRRAVYSFVCSRKGITRKKEGQIAYYSKKEVDRLCEKKEVNMDLYYTARHAAELLGVSLERLYKALRKFNLPKVSVRGIIYISRKEFDDFVEVNRQDGL